MRTQTARAWNSERNFVKAESLKRYVMVTRKAKGARKSGRGVGPYRVPLS